VSVLRKFYTSDFLCIGPYLAFSYCALFVWAYVLALFMAFRGPCVYFNISSEITNYHYSFGALSETART